MLAWSGVETLESADAYNAMPTWEGYDAGEELELRTNVLIGVTRRPRLLDPPLALVLTDWGGEEEELPGQPPLVRLSPLLSPTAGGGAYGLSLSGAF